MDAKAFLQGINYLKANYINWAFDINNDMQIKVWYKKFANLETQTFMAIVERYTETNKFPPQSPADLLDVLRAEISSGEDDPNQAWQEVVRLISQYGFYYGRDKIYAALQDKPALYRTVKDFESELRYLMTDDTYTPQRFKKAYEINLKREAESKTSLMIGAKYNFLLGDLNEI